MTSSKDQNQRLRRLACIAAKVDEAIGVWWFGPRAGRYFVADTQGDLVESDLTLTELERRYERRIITQLDKAVAAISRYAA